MSVIKLRKPKNVEYEDIPIQCLMDIEASSLSDKAIPSRSPGTGRITKTTIRFSSNPPRRGPTGIQFPKSCITRFPRNFDARGHHAL